MSKEIIVTFVVLIGFATFAFLNEGIVIRNDNYYIFSTIEAMIIFIAFFLILKRLGVSNASSFVRSIIITFVCCLLLVPTISDIFLIKLTDKEAKFFALGNITHIEKKSKFYYKIPF